MTINVACKCGQPFQAPDSLAGKAVKCPKCGEAFRVPGATPSETADSPPPETASSACKNCGAGLPANAVLCVNCGLDLRTGRQHGTEAGDVSDVVVERLPHFRWMEYIWFGLIVVLSAGFTRRYAVVRDEQAPMLKVSLRFLGLPCGNRHVELNQFTTILTDYRSFEEEGIFDTNDTYIQGPLDGLYEDVHIIRLSAGSERGRVSFHFWRQATFSAVIDLIRSAHPMELTRA